MVWFQGKNTGKPHDLNGESMMFIELSIVSFEVVELGGLFTLEGFSLEHWDMLFFCEVETG